nr:uncharacterized protein LOC128695320 [Cherax quadricarinatus]
MIMAQHGPERRLSYPVCGIMERQRLIRSTDLMDRARFVRMWVSGKTTRAIARETGSSITTVSRWIRRWKSEGNVNARPRSGRPRNSKLRKIKDLNKLITSGKSPDVYSLTSPETNSPLVSYCDSMSFSNYSTPLGLIFNQYSTLQEILHKYYLGNQRQTLRLANDAVEAVMSEAIQSGSSVLLFTDGNISASDVFREGKRLFYERCIVIYLFIFEKVKEQLWSSWGVAVFDVTGNDHNANVTQAKICEVVEQARQLRQVSWLLTVIVVSDDAAFLAAFAECSLKGRLLVWSTRLLALTRLPLLQLHQLHTLLSTRNALLLIVNEYSGTLRCNMYIFLPYTAQDSQPLRVAWWTPHHGLTLTLNLPLFPDKFFKFLQSPRLVVAVVPMEVHNALLTVDPTAPEGQRITYIGHIDKTVKYLGSGLNFTYRNSPSNKEHLGDCYYPRYCNSSSSKEHLGDCYYPRYCNSSRSKEHLGDCYYPRYCNSSSSKEHLGDCYYPRSKEHLGDCYYPRYCNSSSSKEHLGVCVTTQGIVTSSSKEHLGDCVTTQGIVTLPEARSTLVTVTTQELFDSLKEADISIGPFSQTATRTEAVDFAWPLWMDSSGIVAALGRPEVDPWGFVLPLRPLVWVAILTAMLVMPSVIYLYSSCVSTTIYERNSWMSLTYGFIRILLQQDFSARPGLWWKRMLLAVWMMVTLVLTRSYAGNLMALLAVRYIPQPYQSLQDVVDDQQSVMIWQSQSVNTEQLREIKVGILYEVSKLADEGRILYRNLEEFPNLADTVVRKGHYVLFGIGILLRNLQARLFTRTGRCDFYSSSERILPFAASIVSQKDNPIVPAMQNRILALTESGIYERWYKTNIPNSTVCLQPPKKYTVQSPLSLTNLWGMFLILIGGSGICVLVFGAEILSACVPQTWEGFPMCGTTSS